MRNMSVYLAVLLAFVGSFASAQTAEVPQNYVEQANCDLNMNMIYVEGGKFIMGANDDDMDAYEDEFPRHYVYLDSYYIAECEVTQEQWEKIMGNTIHDYIAVSEFYGYSVEPIVGENFPMNCVNWYDAQMFCARLSQLTGKTYVLPSEAQWEYAARGGKKGKGYKYSGSYSIDAVAWYRSNSIIDALAGYIFTNCCLHPVKQKRPNELGIYDMSGNVWEWCADWYGKYVDKYQSNPTGPGSGSRRVLRGGNRYNEPFQCRVSYRDTGNPYSRYSTRGFRVICIP